MIRESFDIQFILEKTPSILSALPVTLEITILTLLFGWSLGLLLAWARISGPGAVKGLLGVLSNVIRGIPTVVLLYIVYFGLPKLIHISFREKISYVILALTVELSITAGEMFRSAYNSIKQGQLEAAHALGYTRWQRFVHVILPQGLYVILPNLGSAVLSIIQATALVYTLGIFDILGKARQIDTNVSHIKTFEMYFAVAIIYWILAIIIQTGFHFLEKRFGRAVKK